MSYLNNDALQLSLTFGKGFYENLGTEMFTYDSLQLFDTETNYSLSGTRITALPILDVNIKEKYNTYIKG